MDRRVFLAVLLTAIVIVVTPLVFPGASRPRRRESVTAGKQVTVAPESIPKAVTEPAQSMPPAMRLQARQREADRAPTDDLGSAIGDTTSVASPHMVVWYSDVFGTPARIALTDYVSRNPILPAGPVLLQAGPSSPLLRYNLIIGDTILPFYDAHFVARVMGGGNRSGVEFYGRLGNRNVSIEYGSPVDQKDRYLLHVLVRVDGAPTNARLQVELPSTLVSGEKDTTDDVRHLAFGYKPSNSGVESVPFAKLDSTVVRNIPGSLEWIAIRNKYFLFAVISPDSSILNANISGAPRIGKLASRGTGSGVFPLRDGSAAFDLYTGPQEFDRLRSLGYQLDHVNPYAGFLHGVVQPFATVVTQVLLWMKRTSGLGYGWVIIIFGVGVRLLLWPLNQSAMRTSIRMQRLQPELTEVQRRYKSDPEKQRAELVKLYQAHGMTPFSPMMGCLPMLLPMPILFALYFVFLNTIAFRGVSFLWMKDISAADPYYITPVVMGLSMFALSWIGMRGTPPTAQTRMMSYMMPVVLTFMFFRFAAGLNLYYAVQNLAALPQQWMLARERAGMNAVDTSGQREKVGIGKGKA